MASGDGKAETAPINNDRGVTTRGMNDGGEQERVLANKYDTMSKAMASRWPKTAGISKPSLSRTATPPVTRTP